MVVMAQDAPQQDPLSPTETLQQNPEALQQEQPQETTTTNIPPTPGEFSEQGEREALTEQARQQIANNLANRCEAVKAQVSTHAGNFTNFQTNHVSVLARLSEKLGNLQARLDASDAVDGTTMSTLVNQFEEYKTDFETQLSDYETGLNAVLRLECSDQEAARVFYDTLSGVRESNASLVQARELITSLIRSDIKAELEVIKAQLTNEEGGQ